MIVLLIAFVSGITLGVLAAHSWLAGSRDIMRALHKREMDDIFEEVRRLRAQVAGLIGKE